MSIEMHEHAIKQYKKGLNRTETYYVVVSRCFPSFVDSCPQQSRDQVGGGGADGETGDGGHHQPVECWCYVLL